MEKIAIVSCGGVFPEAKNPNDFFKNLLDGVQSIHDFSKPPSVQKFKNRLELFMADKESAEYKNTANRSYSYMGAYLNREWLGEYSEKFNLDVTTQTSTELFALEAASQVIEPIKNKINFARTDVILGCTSVDNECIDRLKENVLERIRMDKNSAEYKNILSHIFNVNVPKEKFGLATSLLKNIVTKFGIGGHSFLIDAACASSFASLNTAQERLRQGQADFVLWGGVDVNLSPFLLSMFSKLGVLNEERMNPFDMRSKGMNPGEAAAMVMLCRLEIALEKKFEILGVIENCQGSSDGLKGSPTEPTIEGQVLAYSRTNKYNNDTIPKVDYIEAHGTGTIIGDRVEIGSLQKFYGDVNKGVPIGSVKANIGHTIAAAGTVSVIKCLKIIETRKIPPNKRFDKFPHYIQTDFFINKDVIQLDPDKKLNFTISSFGFGGTNFHLHLSQFNPEIHVLQNPVKSDLASDREVYLNAEIEVSFEQLNSLLAKTRYRIPPKTIANYDLTVLLAFLTLEELLVTNHIHISDEDKKEIHCLSTGGLSLDKPMDLMMNLSSELLLNDEYVSSETKKTIATYKNTLPVFNEDTGPTTLNNLISGRTAKLNGFQGLNFHIDADLASESAGLLVGSNLVKAHNSAVFLIHSIEKFNTNTGLYQRTGIKVQLISSKDFSYRADLPIKSMIDFNQQGQLL